MTGIDPVRGTRSLRHNPSNAVAKYDAIGKEEILAEAARNYQKGGEETKPLLKSSGKKV